MQKSATKILITLLLLLSLHSLAIAQSELFVSTGGASNITQTTANLHGTGGWNADYPPGCNSSTLFSSTTGLPCNSGSSTSLPTLPITGYFRYSTLPISPVYCNDIYGSSMLSTRDYPLNTLGATVNRQNFAQSIFNLKPNTTYYYCAIISNRDNIAYGGTNAVREFHTNCLDTTVETKSVTNVRSTSARLHGSYCSTKTVKTSFEYQAIPSTSQVAQPWIKVGEVNRSIGTNSNIYGNFNFNLTGLRPSIAYQYRAVAETSTENPTGQTENFTTTPIGPTIPPLPPVCLSPQVLNPATNICITPPPPTCTLPRVLNPTTNTCVTPPPPPTCTLPRVLNPTTNTCVTPPPPPPLTCTLPQILSLATNTCVTPPTCQPPQVLNPSNNSCFTPVSCEAPQVLNPSNNSCFTPPPPPPSCQPPQVLNLSTNTCVTPPPPGFCITNPTDPTCVPGPGWEWDEGTWDNGTWDGSSWSDDTWSDGTWSGGSWDNGTWSGGTWSGGTWSGGTWSSGTWSGGTWANGAWIGGNWSSGTGVGGYKIINSTSLVLGQKVTPPWDAIVRYHEGIETVFARQIMADVEFARLHGYRNGMDLSTFAGELAHTFSKMFGYVDASGREIRVSFADRAAYQLQLTGNKLTVYEYFDERIVDIRNATATFKTASGYEYNFKK